MGLSMLPEQIWRNTEKPPSAACIFVKYNNTGRHQCVCPPALQQRRDDLGEIPVIINGDKVEIGKINAFVVAAGAVVVTHIDHLIVAVCPR